ncbi:hypothetical protein [Anoxybacteroides amylolyticum]|uniref:hypothetical protein n=1 Tax=Anoxybacteroides amylolyticum TaxID=294699 RepID=UPI0008354B8B|nr:hypothetical protein [Anoxybacillus amylolyticus]
MGVVDLGYNLKEADSDHDGVADVNEDEDGDGLSNGAEGKLENHCDHHNYDDGIDNNESSNEAVTP